jgi:hypothetical protein
MARKMFKTVKKGDRPSAGEHTKITKAIGDLTAFSRTAKTYSKVRLVKMDQVMGDFFVNPSDQHINRTGSFRFYNRGTDTFDAGDRPEVNTFCDPFELVYDEDEYLLAVYSEQGSKFYPINPRTVRHAITCRDASNNYPDRSDNPDTYPIRWVKLVYTEAGGRQGHALTYLNSDNVGSGGTNPFHDDHVHNIIDPDLPDAYIPEGTLIECYNVTRQWFTMYNCESEDSSESVSYSSYSSGSSFSSSASSQSPSNSSSESASLSESSSASSVSSDESSASSISGSSSGSSASVSDSSGGSSVSASSDVSVSGSSRGSSVSVSESSGFECISFVTSVCFDSGSCTLTVTCAQICFPKSLGVTTGAGECGEC